MVKRMVMVLLTISTFNSVNLSRPVIVLILQVDIFVKKIQHIAVCSIQNIRIFVIDEERPQKNLTKSLNSQRIRRCSGNIS